jgi:hypothetical protein
MGKKMRPLQSMKNNYIRTGNASDIPVPRRSNKGFSRGLYIGKYQEISDDVIWGKKYEKAKRKRGKM